MRPIIRPFIMAVPVTMLLAFFCFTSCQKTANTTGDSTLELYLTDAPGDYRAVLIDIQKVWVQVTLDSSSDLREASWEVASLSRTGLYNLLHFRNGNDTMLAAVGISAGTVTKIRLQLGKNNTLVLNDGEQVPLMVPSDVESGAKLVVKNGTRASYALVLDFDVSRSVVKAGTGDSTRYIFSPYVRTFPKEAGGAIEGWVLPDSARAHVLAISASHDSLTTFPDPGGYYKFWGIPEGTYRLQFLADPSTGYRNSSLEGIQVSQGQLFTADTARLRR